MTDIPIRRALVVGGDGLIGAAIVETLHARGVDVIATTRRRERVSSTRPFFDLADAAPPVMPAADVAFLCCAETSIARCESDPEHTRLLNVDRLSRLADECHEAGAFLVLPSSTAVFDGRQPHRCLDEPVSPATEYGRQKAAVEAHVLGLGHSATVRLAKVFGVWPSLFVSWRAALMAGQPVRAFSDMVLAPVTAALAAEALVAVATSRGEGIFHLSADRDVTYVAVAQRLADRMQVPPDLVVSSPAAAVPAAARPANTTLDVTRLTRDLGIEAPDAWSVIDEVTPLVSRGSACIASNS